MSRINVQIQYEPLDSDARQQIWENYFEKLISNHEHGGRQIEYAYTAKEFVQRDSDLEALQWNGREIRNGKTNGIQIETSMTDRRM
jgi:hypothetical protein